MGGKRLTKLAAPVGLNDAARFAEYRALTARAEADVALAFSNACLLSGARALTGILDLDGFSITEHALDQPTEDGQGFAKDNFDFVFFVNSQQYFQVDGSLSAVADISMRTANGSRFSLRNVASAEDEQDLLNNATLESLLLALAAAQPDLPVGTVMPFFGPSTKVPSGWLLCDGSVLVRSQNLPLFTALGVTYGTGNPANTTFRLPDMRGRVSMGTNGQGHGVNSVSTALGSRFGSETISLGSPNFLPSHTHPRDDAIAGTHSPLSPLVPNCQPGTTSKFSYLTTVNITGVTGQAQEFSVLQPSLVVNWIIRA